MLLKWPLLVVLLTWAPKWAQSAPIVPIIAAIATSAAGLFQVQVDVLHIAKYMRDAADCKRNRAAFVRDLLYTAFYRSGQSYNVIVFNLGEEHRQRLYGVLFYGSVAHPDGTRFGVWIFEHGVFENNGARGWHNWGMIGSFKKSKNGDIIYFQRRHKIKNTTPVQADQILEQFNSPGSFIDKKEILNEKKNDEEKKEEKKDEESKEIVIKLEQSEKKEKKKEKKDDSLTTSSETKKDRKHDTSKVDKSTTGIFKLGSSTKKIKSSRV